MKHSTTVPVNALPSAEKYAGNGPLTNVAFM